MLRSDIAAHLVQRVILIQTILIADIAHRHHFDKRDVHPARMGPVDHLHDLIVIHAFQRNGVDLDRQPGFLRRIDAVHDLRKAAPAGNVGEFLFIQRVQRDVHPLDADIGQLLRKPTQL